MKKKRILIIVGIVILIIILLIIFVLLNKQKETEIVVSYDEVEGLYNSLDTTTCEANCDEREYVSKLFGYSYDKEGNLQLDIAKGYVENEKVYDLDGNEIGDYDEDNIKDILDKGTITTYYYSKTDDSYELVEG